jgi:hypothetical protein
LPLNDEGVLEGKNIERKQRKKENKKKGLVTKEEFKKGRVGGEKI